MMNYVQAIFTYLWTIWNHSNLVLHEDKDPNPMEVILTAQNFICKFQVAFSSSSMQGRRPVQHPYAYQNLEGPWDLLIKIDGIKKSNPKELPMLMKPLISKELPFSQVVLVVQQSILMQHCKKHLWRQP